jgi:succinoglycan biosynthesis protein ExoA
MPFDPAPLSVEDESNLADDARLLFVSVILPVRNEARFIQRVLTELVGQDYDRRRFEVIVVDGESTDDTPALVGRFTEQHSNVHLLRNPKRWSSAARNIGIRAARGDVVVIVDGHCEIGDDQFLTKLATAFVTSGADCLGRPQPLDVSQANTLQRAIAAARSSRLGHHPESYIYASEAQFVPAKSVAVAYRRSVFDQVGYFDESFDAHEDGEFNYRVDRAGLRCFFTPEIAVKYCPRGNLLALFRQMIRYGRGRIRLLRKHPGSASISTFTPAAFVLGLALGLPLSFISPWLAAAYVGALLAYLSIVLLGSLGVFFQLGSLPLLAWLPLVFATIHVGSGVGLLLEFVVPQVDCR